MNKYRKARKIISIIVITFILFFIGISLLIEKLKTTNTPIFYCIEEIKANYTSGTNVYVLSHNECYFEIDEGYYYKGYYIICLINEEKVEYLVEIEYSKPFIPNTIRPQDVLYIDADEIN